MEVSGRLHTPSLFTPNSDWIQGAGWAPSCSLVTALTTLVHAHTGRHAACLAHGRRSPGSRNGRCVQFVCKRSSSCSFSTQLRRPDAEFQVQQYEIRGTGPTCQSPFHHCPLGCAITLITQHSIRSSLCESVTRHLAVSSLGYAAENDRIISE
jgi:hypothetical protein